MSDEHTALIKGLFLVLIVCCAWADATPAEAERIVPIGCRIEIKADGDLVRLDAVARSRESVAGHYRFAVQKRGRTGSSQNSQSGNFSLDGDGEKILSTTVLGGSSTDHYQAKLSLDSNSGSVSCSSP